MLSKGSRYLREAKEIPALTNGVLEERRMDRKTGHVARGDFTVHHCDMGHLCQLCREAGDTTLNRKEAVGVEVACCVP